MIRQGLKGSKKKPAVHVIVNSEVTVCDAFLSICICLFGGCSPSPAVASGRQARPVLRQLPVCTSTATHPSVCQQPQPLPGRNANLTYFRLSPQSHPPTKASQPEPSLRGHSDLNTRPHGTDRPALSSPCAPRYGLRLPGCNLVTARPAGWKVGLGSGSSAGCLWKPQGR